MHSDLVTPQDCRRAHGQFITRPGHPRFSAPHAALVVSGNISQRELAVLWKQSSTQAAGLLTPSAALSILRPRMLPLQHFLTGGDVVSVIRAQTWKPCQDVEVSKQVQTPIQANTEGECLRHRYCLRNKTQSVRWAVPGVFQHSRAFST